MLKESNILRLWYREHIKFILSVLIYGFVCVDAEVLIKYYLVCLKYICFSQIWIKTSDNDV